jgi:glutathione S-transferase
MFLDYRIMPGKAPLPVIALSGARVVGGGNILTALARKTGNFLPAGDFAAWLAAAPDIAALAAQLESRDFIMGEVSIADMSVYPRIAGRADVPAAHSTIARWATRMMQRPAVGRGMVAIAG